MADETTGAGKPPSKSRGIAVSRRTATRTVLGGVTGAYGVALGYPIVRYLVSGTEGVEETTAVSEVSLGAPDQFQPGTGTLFRFGNRPALALRRPDGTFVAFFATCSHLGCTVKYAPEKDRITCACHGGVYDPQTGKNVGGPPPAPLKPLTVEVTPGGVVVRKA
jgi:cytochrome b6-f complex iron-sulfur subunit